MTHSTSTAVKPWGSSANQPRASGILIRVQRITRSANGSPDATPWPNGNSPSTAGKSQLLGTEKSAVGCSLGPMGVVGGSGAGGSEGVGGSTGCGGGAPGSSMTLEPQAVSTGVEARACTSLRRLGSMTCCSYAVDALAYGVCVTRCWRNWGLVLRTTVQPQSIEQTPRRCKTPARRSRPRAAHGVARGFVCGWVDACTGTVQRFHP